MAIDFDKIDRSVDLKGLQADVEDAKKNGGDDFPTIPAGKYEAGKHGDQRHQGRSQPPHAGRVLQNPVR